jgi:hypothetical protein
MSDSSEWSILGELITMFKFPAANKAADEGIISTKKIVIEERCRRTESEMLMTCTQTRPSNLQKQEDAE